jgi:hypothetical protein
MDRLSRVQEQLESLTDMKANQGVISIDKKVFVYVQERI